MQDRDFERGVRIGDNRFGSHPYKRFTVKALSLGDVVQGEYAFRQETGREPLRPTSIYKVERERTFIRKKEKVEWLKKQEN